MTAMRSRLDCEVRRRSIMNRGSLGLHMILYDERMLVEIGGTVVIEGLRLQACVEAFQSTRPLEPAVVAEAQDSVTHGSQVLELTCQLHVSRCHGA